MSTKMNRDLSIEQLRAVAKTKMQEIQNLTTSLFASGQVPDESASLRSFVTLGDLIEDTRDLLVELQNRQQSTKHGGQSRTPKELKSKK